MARPLPELQDHRKALAEVKGWHEFDWSMVKMLQVKPDVRLVYMWSDLYADIRRALREHGYDVARGVRYAGRSVVAVPKC